jgi:hypothetical protein
MLDAQMVRQLLPTMRYVALDEPRLGVHGDWCVRARRIGDASESPMLVRFFQSAVDREGLRPLRLDQSTAEFLFPQQLLTLPGNLVATVRACFEPVSGLTSHQLLQWCRRGDRLLAFLLEQNRVHGHLTPANLTPCGQFADAGWAWLTGHGVEDGEQLARCFRGMCPEDELGRRLAARLERGWGSWSPRLVEEPDVGVRVDGRVRVGEGRALCHFEGDVLGVAFSPDGRWLAAVGDRPFARLVEVESGVVVELAHQASELRDPCFSPDGRWLAARHYGGVQLWDLSDRSHRVWSYAESPRGLAFSLEGDLVVSWGSEVEVLGLPDGLPRLDVEEVRVAVPSSDLHPQLRLRAVGEQAGMTNYGGLWADVQLYDFEGQLVWSQGVCRDKVPCVAFSPDGSLLACGSSGDDSTREFPVMLWRLEREG